MFKRGVGVTGFAFELISKTDGSPITSGTVTGYCTLDGGTQTALVGSITHKGNGQWTVNLGVGETDGNIVALLFAHADAVPVHFTIKTVTVLPSDLNDFDPASDTVDVGKVAGSAVAGVDDFKADVSGLSTFDASSDTVDVGAVAGSAVAGVNDFKADVSGLFDPSTYEVDGVTFDSWAAAVMSVLFGETTVGVNQVEFLARDGETTVVTVTYNPSLSGDRTGSVIA